MSSATPPRPRLGRDDVIVAAERLVDEHGWDGLTMARLAENLGVRAPSLYTHVRGLDELRADLQVRAMEDLATGLCRTAMGRTGDAGIRALAAAVRDFAHRHPARYDGMTRSPIDRDRLLVAAADASTALLTMLPARGLVGEDLVELQVSAFAALHGVVALEINGFLGREVDADAVFEHVVDATIRQLKAATRTRRST